LQVQDFYKSLTSLLVKGSGVWEPSPPINPELMDVLTSLRSGINGNPGSDRPREGNDDPDARVEEVSSVIHLDIIFQTPSDKSAILLTNARRQMGDGWKSLTDEDVRNLVEGQLLETVYSILKRRDDKLYLSLVSSLLEADDKVTQQASMAKPIQGDVPSDSSSAALKGSRPADPSSYAPSIEIDDTVEAILESANKASNDPTFKTKDRTERDMINSMCKDHGLLRARITQGYYIDCLDDVYNDATKATEGILRWKKSVDKRAEENQSVASLRALSEVGSWEKFEERIAGIDKTVKDLDVPKDKYREALYTVVNSMQLINEIEG